MLRRNANGFYAEEDGVVVQPGRPSVESLMAKAEQG
jgi:hypothetical protein